MLIDLVVPSVPVVAAVDVEVWENVVRVLEGGGDGISERAFARLKA